MHLRLLPAIGLLMITLCRPASNESTQEQPIDHVPKWAQEAVWYQIFVERFRNGDPTNDPSRADLMGGDPAFIPANWSVTPWSHDWYKREAWMEDLQVDHFYHKMQARRFGGDLQGVLDKMDYLVDLGITAIYFNPLNDAPSMHKFDARHWRHVDHNFGPDPAGDVSIMSEEIPDNPSTWQWTAADRLFLKVVEELHNRGIKVIMDYSWNHTGIDFWAIHDLRERGEESKFKDWFAIHSFDDPATSEDEFDYEGWAGYKYMPVVKKRIDPPTDSVMPFEGNLVSETLKEHIFNVTRRWLDPNGDGDPSDGVDGFRLDVAAEVPKGFWRDYKKEVRKVNPEAYIVGEVWWLDWPSTLLEPRGFLGDQFDAIMNYRWYRIARSFFGQPEDALTATEFVQMIGDINAGIKPEALRAMMNMSASHDAPRLSTSLYNKNRYKYQAKPSDDPKYKIDKPGEHTRQIQKMLLVHQFTFIGSPQIWNGDEVGMWGADDPDCRKPMVWEDLEYEVERTHFYAAVKRQPDTVRPDLELHAFYKELIAMRKENPVCIHGDFEFIHAGDTTLTLAYRRVSEDAETLVLFNRDGQPRQITLTDYAGEWGTLLAAPFATFQVNSGALEAALPALGYLVLHRKN